jgi:hypothetical protein
MHGNDNKSWAETADPGHNEQTGNAKRALQSVRSEDSMSWQTNYPRGDHHLSGAPPVS